MLQSIHGHSTRRRNSSRSVVWPLLVALGAFGCSDKGDSLGTTTGSVGSAGDGSGGPAGFGANTSTGTGGGTTGSGNGNASGNGGEGTVDPTVPAACSVIEGLPSGVECGSEAGTATIRKPNMLLVLDKSGSQINEESSFEGVLNWDALLEALDVALTDVQNEMALGLKMYPDDDIIFDCMQGACCKVSPGIHIPIGRGTETVPEILELLNMTEPAGGTPTAAGLRAALAYFTEGDGADIKGEKYVLLATDGGPNCNAENDSCINAAELCTINLEGRCNTPNANCCEDLGELSCVDNDETVAAITALREAGIDTYVVGIPGSEGYASFLDEFAIAGGRPNPDGPEMYYAVDAAGGVDALTDVFQEITTQLVQTCDFELDVVPPDPEKVNVALDCTAISRGERLEDGGEGDGAWTLDESTDPPTIRLLGATCEQVQSTGVERVDFIFGCPTIR